MNRKQRTPPGTGRSDAPREGLIGAIGPAARLLGIGWFFVVAILGGAGLGWWIGQGFSSRAPQVIAVLVGLLIGVALAVYGGYQFVRETVDASDVTAKEKGGPPVG